MTAHTQTAHIVEKAPEPMPPTEVMPVVEKAPEPMPPTEVITEQMPELAKVTGVFEVFVDAAGRFRFHLKAANGQIIAVSQSYGTKESAIKGIASIKKNAPIAKINDFTTSELLCQSLRIELELSKTQFLKFNAMLLISSVSI